MTTKDSVIEEVNYVARLFVQSYYNTLIEERNKMYKYFLPSSQFSFSQGVQESIPVTGRENIQKAFDSIAKSSIKVDLRSGSIDACGNKDEVLILIHGVMYIDSVANSYSQTVFLRKDAELDSLIIAYDVIRVENVNELVAPPEEIAEVKADVSVPQSPLRESKPVEKASSPKSETVITVEIKQSTVDSTTTITPTPSADSTKQIVNNNSNNNNNNKKNNNRNKYRNKRNNNKSNQQQQQQQQQSPPPPPSINPSSPESIQPSPPPPLPSSTSTNQSVQPQSSTTTTKQQQQSKSKPKSKQHINNNNNKDINKEKDNSKANSVVIKNLAESVKEEMLKDTLSQFGEVKHIKIIPSITSYIAFVDFSDEKGKNAVLEFIKSNKLTIESRDITVEEHRIINNHGYYPKRRY